MSAERPWLFNALECGLFMQMSCMHVSTYQCVDSKVDKFAILMQSIGYGMSDRSLDSRRDLINDWLQC